MQITKLDIQVRSFALMSYVISSPCSEWAPAHIRAFI
jgi:hypothetical protein